MEEPKSSRIDDKQRRNKIQVHGVGGIAGLVVLGGAFAVAALIANKTSKKKPDGKNQELPTNPTQKVKSKEEASGGLLSLLETASPSIESHRCCRVCIEHGASKLGSVQFVAGQIMQEGLVLEVNGQKEAFAYGDQEIVCAKSKVQTLSVSDDVNISQDGDLRSEDSSLEETGTKFVHDNIGRDDRVMNVLSKENAATAEGDLSEVKHVDDVVLKENTSTHLEVEDPSGESLLTEAVAVKGKDELCETTSAAEDVFLNENASVNIEVEDRSLVVEAVTVIGKVELCKITTAANVTLKEKLMLQLNELDRVDAEVEDDSSYDYDYDDNDDHDSDDEKDGEGSEGTGDSSMESNADAIWPAEWLEEDCSIAKDMKSRLLTFGQEFKEEASKVVVQEESKAQDNFGMEKDSRASLMQHPMLMLPRRRLFLWAIVVVGLLIFMFAHHLSVFYHIYSFQPSS